MCILDKRHSTREVIMGMPANIKELYDELKDAIMWLNEMWNMVENIFTTGCLDFLDECDSLFFVIVKSISVEGVVLSLCKITDKSHTYLGKVTLDNLTLSLLHDQLKATEPAVANELQSIHDEALVKCNYFRPWRNKLMAHSDRITITEPDPTKRCADVPDITKESIMEAIEPINKYMNMLEKHYGVQIHDYTRYKLVKTGEALISLLEDGLHYRKHLSEGKTLAG
jgi:hypothetical protein